jgi:hypothetical protein
MTKPAARPVLRAERIRIRLIVAWYAAAMAALVMALLAVIAMAPESRLKADRERTYQRQATVITENLAASLISPGQNPSGSQRSDGLLVASPAELGAVLKTYRQLTSITVASSGVRPEAMTLRPSRRRDEPSPREGSLRVRGARAPC